MIIDTDVFISVVSSDLYHMLFLLPGSAVIAYYQSFVQDYSWSLLAEVSHLAYYPVFNTSVPLPAECNGTFQTEECQYRLGSQPVFIRYGQLHNYLRVASVHVHMNKYPEAIQRMDT